MGAVGRAVLAAVVLLSPLPSEASVGVITDSRVPVFRDASAGARAVLGDEARVHDLADSSPEEIQARLSSDRPEAVIAVGPSAVRVAAGAAPGTPVVFLLVANAQATADTLAGRPVRGIALNVPPEPTLQLLRRIAPKARGLWTIYSQRASGGFVDKLQGVATAAGYSLQKTEVPDAASAARALSAPPPRVDATILLGDTVVRNAAFDQALMRLAFSRGFPVVGASRSDVRAGALFAFQLDAEALGRQAAGLARSPGKGGPESVIVPPAGSRLVLNMATARNLGLTIPEDVRQSAVEVFGE
ncbi:MAG: hypothetical protein HY901_12245 [Deltaproteobacteria bacterium]|nr:hypothetical protein [Deltaproteobacteria bacterium]